MCITVNHVHLITRAYFKLILSSVMICTYMQLIEKNINSFVQAHCVKFSP